MLVQVLSLQLLLALRAAAPAAASRLNAMYDSAARPAPRCALPPRGEGRRIGALDADDDEEAEDADHSIAVVPYKHDHIVSQQPACNRQVEARNCKKGWQPDRWAAGGHRFSVASASFIRPAKAMTLLMRQPLPGISGLPSRSRNRRPLVWQPGWISQTWTPQPATPAAASRLVLHPVPACAGSHAMDGMDGQSRFHDRARCSDWFPWASLLMQAKGTARVHIVAT